MPDLRVEFERLMRHWGIDVYLQRRVHPTGDGIYQYPEGSQANYFSKGLEKFTVRYTFAGRKTALASIAEEREEGIVHTVERIYWFPHFANPREGDRIYQQDPRYPDEFEIYIIQYAQPYRGVGGRIEFWESGCVRHGESTIGPASV